MRYMLFGGYEYHYAKGGSHDFMESSNDLEYLQSNVEAIAEKLDFSELSWWHIFDIQTNNILYESENQAYGVY